MTRMLLRHLAAAALALLVGAPAMGQTSSDTLAHARRTTTVHTTTRHATHTTTAARRKSTRKRRTTLATRTRTTRKRTTTHVTAKRKAEPAMTTESDGVRSNAVADSIATKSVIQQTPPNDTASVRSRTTITTVGGTTTLINLNTATREELMTLPGVDAVLADRIIAGRPFVVITDLTGRGILTPAEYTRIETHIVVTPP